MKKDDAEKLETERRAKRILRVQIAYQSTVKDMSIAEYLLKKIRSGANSSQNSSSFVREVNDELQEYYIQRRALLCFRSCFLTTVIAARGVPANFPTKMRLELLLPSPAYRRDVATNRNSGTTYRGRMIDFMSFPKNYQVVYTFYTSSSNTQLSDPSNPIWFRHKQDDGSTSRPSNSRAFSTFDEGLDHEVGQTFVFPFTGDEICILRLTLMHSTQYKGDIELASGTIDMHALPFDSSISPWIEMDVRDTAVKGKKVKNCAVKLAITWLNLKGKQRRAPALPPGSSSKELSLLVSLTDAVDLPRMAFGRKPQAHVDVSVGDQQYRLGNDFAANTEAVRQCGERLGGGSELCKNTSN